MSHFPDWKRQGGGEVYRGTHYLVVSRRQGAMKAVRGLMDEVNIRPACFRYTLTRKTALYTLGTRLVVSCHALLLSVEPLSLIHI